MTEHKAIAEYKALADAIGVLVRHAEKGHPTTLDSAWGAAVLAVFDDACYDALGVREKFDDEVKDAKRAGHHLVNRMVDNLTLSSVSCKKWEITRDRELIRDLRKMRRLFDSITEGA